MGKCDPQILPNDDLGEGSGQAWEGRILDIELQPGNLSPGVHSNSCALSPHQAQISFPVSLPAKVQFSDWQFLKDLQVGSWGKCRTRFRSFLSFLDNNPGVWELVGYTL